MKLTYDDVEDVLYIRLHDESPADSVDQEPGVTVDLDENGRVIGIEILDASARLELLCDDMEASSEPSSLLNRSMPASQ